MLTRIAVAGVIGFLAGVWYASVIPVAVPVVMALLLCACVFLFVSWKVPHDRRALPVVVCLCAAVCGMARLELARLHPTPDLSARLNTTVRLEGTIIAEPDVRERSTRLFMDVTAVDGVPAALRVLVNAPSFSRTTYGDRISVAGTLREPEPFESGEGRAFNYPMFLAVRGVSYEVAFAEIAVVGHGGNPLITGALVVKAAYIHGLQSVLPEPYAGLAAGITAGDKRSVGVELSETFRRVSLVHILVLSGYNITVVMSVLMRLNTGMSRFGRLAVALLTIIFFILISGGAASSVRAGAMAFAAAFANQFGRQFVALRVLAAVVLAMVIWNPLILAFDPGFQLSVLATLGLVLFGNDLSGYLRGVTEHFALREILASSIATQVAVLPLLLYQNGLLSLVALPANIFALVAVPLAMAFSAIAACIGIVLGTWGTVLALPAFMLLRYIVFVAETLARLPFATVTIPAFNAYILFLVYGCLACAAYMRHRLSIIKTTP
jgi:competence protein ComEC